MNEPGLSAPFVRHQRTAELLVRTLQQALAPQFAATGTISRADLDRAVGRLLDNPDAATPLFAQACRACLDDPIAPKVRMAMFKPGGRRHDYVTRLLFSTVVEGVPESVDPLTGASFPRVVAPGFQNIVVGLFYDKEWEAMNTDAITVFHKIGTARDSEIWPRIGEDAALPIVAGSVFVRVALRFRQFAFQRQAFMRRMTDLMRERRFAFTDEHFVQLFDRMFGRLRDEVRTELGRARLDTRHGDETSTHLLRIFDEFERHRQDLAQPVRTLSGATRAVRFSQPAGMTQRLLPRRQA